LKLPKLIVVDRVLRTLPGSSGAQLVLCDDGKRYVLKCPNNPLSPNVLANEFIAAGLMHVLNLPISQSSSVTYPEHIRCGYSHAGSAPHFASELLEPSSGGSLYSFLPSSFVLRTENRPDFIGALVFDIWAGSVDDRQAIFVENQRARTFKAVFIDNGHLFGGPHWKFTLRPGTALCLDYCVYNNLFDPETIEGWIAQIETMVPNILPGLVSMVPSQWYNGDIARLQDTLLLRAANLRSLFWEEMMSLKGTLRGLFRGTYGSTDT
jgi:hypothetical protein